MTEIPENVTLEWLARQILEIAQELRAMRREIREKTLPLRSSHDDVIPHVRRRFLDEDDGRGAE
jgi:hypothetical protein